MRRCQYNLGSDREATLARVTEVSKEINSVPICVVSNDSHVLRYVHEKVCFDVSGDLFKWTRTGESRATR
jgi:hypothetical protein